MQCVGCYAARARVITAALRLIQIPDVDIVVSLELMVSPNKFFINSDVIYMAHRPNPVKIL